MKYFVTSITTFCLGQGAGLLQEFTDFERFVGSLLFSLFVCSIVFFQSKDQK